MMRAGEERGGEADGSRDVWRGGEGEYLKGEESGRGCLFLAHQLTWAPSHSPPELSKRRRRHADRTRLADTQVKSRLRDYAFMWTKHLGS